MITWIFGFAIAGLIINWISGGWIARTSTRDLISYALLAAAIITWISSR